MIIQNKEDSVDFFERQKKLRNAVNLTELIKEFTDGKCPQCGSEIDIFEEQQFYYCSACGIGGDCTGYMMSTYKFSIGQVRDFFKERYGI
jgi:ssDNA-binding Zn-finger/Zn-ribbon topoisomerase 1